MLRATRFPGFKLAGNNLRFGSGTSCADPAGSMSTFSRALNGNT
eukprot:CAMPEP_0183441620 /NCGR_PEP_ID=MMETSP0370-20130417/85418_1 /TAXON_ID=268820 /ORGANISM="Peridinium aciculiferum, Strain PAER-2" /LENGTH=43 /DNA_ID= /DNA_START= /DNA_END= /DNA_ORIENTATION=